MARALPTGKTGTLGLLVSDITNPAYFDLVRGAERVASETGMTIVFADSQESAELERSTAERLQTSVDGLLLVGSRLEDQQIQDLSSVKPLVVVNRLVEGIPAVIPDVRPGITAALERLRDAGHRRIAYLAGPEASWMNGQRWQTAFDDRRRLGHVHRGDQVERADPRGRRRGVPARQGRRRERRARLQRPRRARAAARVPRPRPRRAGPVEHRRLRRHLRGRPPDARR